MKYLCLGYLDMDALDAAPAAEKDELLQRCMAQCVPFRATGRILAEESLFHTSQARVVRSRAGKVTVSDGPFIETKEQLGSFFIVEAESLEEAVEIASLHPAAMLGEQYGFGIEVRPIVGWGG